MKRHFILAAACSAGLLSATAASAATLFSGSISLAGTNSIQCRIVNVATTPSQVEIEEFDSNGVVLWSSGRRTIGAGQALVDNAPLATSQMASYCGFVVSGVARSYRAAAENTEPGIGAIGIYPAQ